MFASEPFESLIRPWTLHFLNPKLERYYQDFKQKEYVQQYTLVYLVFGSLLTSIGLSSYLAVNYFINGYEFKGYGMLASLLLVVAGICLELIVNLCTKLQKGRTVILGILVFVASAVRNSIIERLPTFRPGYNSNNVLTNLHL